MFYFVFFKPLLSSFFFSLFFFFFKIFILLSNPISLIYCLNFLSSVMSHLSGLHVMEGPGKSVFVQYIKPELGAARSRRIEVGDQIVAMTASWGDRMWEVSEQTNNFFSLRYRM